MACQCEHNDGGGASLLPEYEALLGGDPDESEQEFDQQFDQEFDQEWEGETPKPPVQTRRWLCEEADRKKVEGVAGKAVASAKLRADVAAAARRAVTLARKAAAQLEQNPRSAGIRKVHREVFGMTPEFVPAWRKPTDKWKDRGQLTAIRLRAVAKLLEGGHVRYFCWGSSTHCPECTGDALTYHACSSWGIRYVICLGKSFWEDWKAGRTTSMAGTLLHEALHIYFGTLIAHGDKGRTSDAGCFERFILLANKLALPPSIAGQCTP